MTISMQLQTSVLLVTPSSSFSRRHSLRRCTSPLSFFQPSLCLWTHPCPRGMDYPFLYRSTQYHATPMVLLMARNFMPTSNVLLRSYNSFLLWKRLGTLNNAACSENMSADSTLSRGIPVNHTPSHRNRP